MMFNLTIVSRHDIIMIKTFKCKETEKLFWGHFSKKLPQNIQAIALRKLKVLNAVTQLDALRIPPSNQLESLYRERKGQYSIRINDQWRICFNWQIEHALNVEITDYH